MGNKKTHRLDHWFSLLVLKVIALTFVLATSTDVQAQTVADVVGVPQTIERADNTLRRVEGTATLISAQVSDAIRQAADSVRELSRRFDSGTRTLAVELRNATLRLQVLLDRVDVLLNTFRTCTRQDVRYLLASVDATASSITESNVPWNRSGTIVSAGHALGNPMRIGLTVGVPSVYVLEGSFPRLSTTCSSVSARVLPVILNAENTIATEPKSVPVEGSDGRTLTVRLPALLTPGIYKIEVAYPTRSGIINTCDSTWSYATWIFPVAPRARRTTTVSYQLTPVCYRLASSSDLWSRQINSTNGVMQSDSNTLPEGCRYTSIDVQHVGGDHGATYQLTDDRRTITFTVRSRERECTRRVFGVCVDWAGHDSTESITARYECDRLTEARLPAIEGEFSNFTSGSRDSRSVTLPREVLDARDGMMCRWSLNVNYREIVNGQQTMLDSIHATQSSPATPPASGAEVRQWYEHASPTADTSATLSGQNQYLDVTWSPLAKTLTIGSRGHPEEECGLY